MISTRPLQVAQRHAARSPTEDLNGYHVLVNETIVANGRR